MEVKIRQAVEAEAKETVLVRWKSWLYAYKDIYTEEEINNHFAVKINNEEYLNNIAKSIREKQNWYVAERNNKIVAVMSIGLPDKNVTDAEIYCLYCLPEYIGMGIGSKFFNLAKSIFKSKNIGYFVICALAKNVIGNKFYVKKGGKLIKRYSQEMCGKIDERVVYRFEI